MDPLNPSAELLLKLAALVARADRYISPAGAMQDLVDLESMLLDQEVQEWQIACRSIANAELKRRAS